MKTYRLLAMAVMLLLANSFAESQTYTTYIDQVDASSQSFGRIADYESPGVWFYHDVPIPFVSNAPGFILLSSQDFKPGTTQKYLQWVDMSTPVVLNPSYLVISQSQDTYLTAHFQVAYDATLQCQLVSGGSQFGTAYFKDPWLIDSTSSWASQPINRGADAVFRPISYSQNNIGVSTSYNGVFLNQFYGGNGPFYSVNAPSTQAANGNVAFFSGWTCSPAGSVSFQNPSALTTAIVFNASGATVTAQYSYSTVAIDATIPSGTWITNGGVTVNSGVTLTASSGATVKFPSGGLTVNGTLVANGATFTSTSPSNQWTGITITSSGSSLTGCTISYAYTGITFTNGVTGTMNECTVQNGTYGILIQGGSSPTVSSNTCTYNSNYGIEVLNNGTGVPTIFANSSSNNLYGIYVYNSTPLLQENSCTSNTYGVYCYSHGSPTSGAIGQQGGNTIESNTRYGIWALSSSYPDFGGSIPSKGEYWGTCNNIYGNSLYDAVASSSSGVTAEWNFWNSLSPNVFAASGCYVDDSYAETDPSDCPLGGGAAPIASANGGSTSGSSTGSPFSPAIEAQMRGNYSLAISDYNKVLADTALGSYHQEALARLYSVFQMSRDSSVLATFASLKSSNNNLKQQAEELLASSEAALGHLDNAASLAQDLRSSYPDTQSQIRALLLLVSLRGFNPGYSSVSKAAFAELLQTYAAAVDLRLLGALRNASDVALPPATTPSSDSSVAVDSAGTTLANYPNPFNPSTQIRYTVRQIGFVSLKVYDILGREVATLVNEVKTPGTYNVNWNANQLATGIYFARFEAAGKVAIKKLLYLK